MKVTVTEDVTVVNVNSEEVYFKVLVKEGDDVLAEKFALEAKASAAAAEDSAIAAALSEQVAITQAGIATAAAAEANQERKSDFVTDTSYMGKAPLGSLESSPVWTITKIVVDIDGTTTVTMASNVAWTDRLTVIYS
jgi:adenylate kinase